MLDSSSILLKINDKPFLSEAMEIFINRSGRPSIVPPLKLVKNLPFLNWKHFFFQSKQPNLPRNQIQAFISCYAKELHGIAVIVSDIQELEDYHIAVDVVAAALAVSMAVVVATFVIVAGAAVLLK